ncbi:MAG: N-acetylmuramoyl-L-alanine amidase family protein [Candidatus Midichloriaceae bacterium]|jgi:N-acetyl-anhydromuramyl-L-alanine amidase AmpD|nr:N-acetylmuramoyl-L-alanine amidase family protein [Candidatus Midichloriaceae bacterium]
MKGYNQLQFDILKLPLPSNCYSSREGAEIKALIVHCVGVPELQGVINVFKEYGVSAHYLVPQLTAAEVKEIIPEFKEIELKFPDRAPAIQLVEDSDKAFHVGISAFGNLNENPGCEKGLNACTLGIEFHAPWYGNGDGSDWYKFVNYTDLQKQTGIELIAYLMSKHNIPKELLLAHSTISIGRKTDPGPLFFWKELAEANLCILPKSDEISSKVLPEDAEAMLVSMGLTGGTFEQRVLAYQMQYAPDAYSESRIV